MAENLFGYTVEEALGKTPLDIIVESTNSKSSNLIVKRALKGETWSGQFPVKTKYGERFTVITTVSPCRDENGTIFGMTCVCADARQFQEASPQSSTVGAPQRLDHHQLLQNATVSKISNLASKVKLKMKTNDMDHDSCFPPTTVSESDSNKGSENRPWFPKVLWPWKGNRNGDSSDIIRRTRFGWPWLHYKDQGQESDTKTSSSAERYESPRDIEETPGSSWSSSCGTSSSSSINSDSTNKTDIHFENLDVEISWDDLIIREQIGQGTHVTVYHALLYGSDVTVKIFNKKEYPDDTILSFRKEVIEVVGFMNQQLEIPNDVDPQWASLIESCWSREPQSRPTFKEILMKLNDLQKKFEGPRLHLQKGFMN
ncbi:hypothetical protein SSX86_032616 [Deinandra increscens subsp. villosa]|uniref:PAS domain-containing protein n=1 Tax=Deinandra increscens subsp. villosa TaxID=3103831 RepID=A0AAP0C6R2_9ASTR